MFEVQRCITLHSCTYLCHVYMFCSYYFEINQLPSEDGTSVIYTHHLTKGKTSHKHYGKYWSSLRPLLHHHFTEFCNSNNTNNNNKYIYVNYLFYLYAVVA